MKTLLVYDDEGYIINQITGIYRVPNGIPYLEIEIPEGKRVRSPQGVDVSVTPHQAILEDIPKSEVDVLKERIKQQEDALFEIADMLTEVLG